MKTHDIPLTATGPQAVTAAANATARPSASRAQGLTRRPHGLRRWLPLLLLLGVLPLALLMGMTLPLLPIRFSLVAFGSIIVVLGVGAVLLLPDRRRVPWRLIFAIFAAAVILRFLWPNFAYLPIPALPIKNPQRLLWAAAIAYWLYSLATNRELRERLASRLMQPGLAWAVLALFAWRALSVPFSDYSAFGVYLVIREFFDYLPALLFCLTWLRGAEDARRLARWLLAATLLVCALALVEYFRQQNLFLALVPYDPNNEDFLLAALESKVRGGVYRVQASFNHPLLLAQFLSVVLPLILWLALADPSRTVRTVAIFTLLLMPPVLWSTQTRTALGVSAFIAALALTLVALREIRRPHADRRNLGGAVGLVLLAAVGAAVLAFMIQLALGRTQEETSSSQVRIEMLQRAVDAMATSPLVGEGPGVGGFKAANITSRGRVSLDSYWLILLLESGAPALAAFLGLLAAGSWQVVTAMRRGLEGPEMARGAFGLAVLSFALSSSVLGTPHNLPLLYLALGSLVALGAPGRRVPGPRPAQHA